MPFYVTDPDNPGNHIDVIKLQRRNHYKTLPPVLIMDWLKHDLWTRQQAIQLLAGYLPSLSEFALSDTQPRDGLDGITSLQRGVNGLFNPRQDECLRDFLSLKSYSENSPSNETRKPQEWIEWAKGKDFTPYWLEYAANTQSAPAPKVEAVPVKPPVPAIKGVDKRKVQAAFQHIKWDYDHWGKNLASPSNKLKACRVSPGSKKASALWNLADIALYLLDEGIVRKTLDTVFLRLPDWAAEWREKTTLEPD